MMKKTIAALILAAAAATPAMAQTYVYSNRMTAYPVQSQAYVSYGMYGDARQWDPRISSPVFAQDPDPNVRVQLSNQSALIDR